MGSDGLTPASHLVHADSAPTISDGEATQELLRIGDSHKALILGNTQTTKVPTDGRGSAIVTGQLSGTFLQAGNSDSAGDILCYRRNLFQLRGTVILPQKLVGDAQPSAIRASLSATETLRGNPVTLITVPKSVKKASSPGSGESNPKSIDIGLSKEADFLTPLPFCWNRLQFRSATAKGGRRKELQPEQRFTIHLRVHAVFADGSETLLAEKASAPIIVRGRSPGNFPSTVKAVQAQAEKLQPAIPDSIESPDETPVPFNLVDFGSDADCQNVDGAGCLLEQFNVLEDFNTHSPGLGVHNDELVAADISDIFTQSLPSYAQNIVGTFSVSPDFAQKTLDSDVSPTTGDSDYSYHYIALSLDDRTPPVQAVYQPHGVHHKVARSRTIQGSTKRYFGELSD